MPTLAATLKTEIRRITAKELVKVARRLARLRRQIKALRVVYRGQRRSLASLETRVLRLRSRALVAGKPGQGGRGSAELIRSLRAKLGMTRKEFATLVGVSPGSIFGWETGRTIPRGGSLARLAEIRKKGASARSAVKGVARGMRRRRRPGLKKAA